MIWQPVWFEMVLSSSGLAGVKGYVKLFCEDTHSPLTSPTFWLLLCLLIKKTSPLRPSPVTLSSTFSVFHFSIKVCASFSSCKQRSFKHIHKPDGFLLQLLSLADKAFEEIAIVECLLCARQCIKPFICMISGNSQYISMNRTDCL